jgi:galactokinase
MMDKGYKAGGMDILISGNIPNGAGLSSSASLEMLIAVIANDLFNEGKIDRVELVKISQKAENEFVGVNCGIMDQFAIGMGKKNKAIMLNCGTLEYSYADMELGDYSIVIMNTNKRRALNESKYNERRAECDEALAAIRKEKDIKNLCDLTKEEYEQLEHLIEKENVKKRARHAVFENERVKETFNSLNSGNLKRVGELLVESHISLRNLYEVTGKELDTIVEESLKIDGCIGARMTGAGFGGCAIALVKNAAIDKFTKTVGENYAEKIGYAPSFYFSGVGEGTSEI